MAARSLAANQTLGSSAMWVKDVGLSDSICSTNNANGSAPTNTPALQTSNAQPLQEQYGVAARFVSQYSAYQPAGSSTPTPSAPPPSSKPASDPNVQPAVNHIFAAAAKGSNPTQCERKLANALAGQPPKVVAAVRNDPRYRTLLNRFIDATVGASAKPPANPNDPLAARQWLGPATESLVNLTVSLRGQPSKFNGLPPSIAADVVNSPKVQALLANLNRVKPSLDNLSVGNSGVQSAYFGLESYISDALGSTPAGRQFTQETAKQIIGALRADGVPQGEYSQYLDVKDAVGAPTLGSQQASPALAIAIAQQLQAGGDGRDAHSIVNDAASAVKGAAASSVTKALSDYQQKTADLNWLIANLGGGATQKQLNAAVQNYINQQNPTWKAAYQQDKAILQARSQNLANSIAQLESLPPGLQSAQVDSTLKSLAGNQSVRQALGLALANDPASVVGSDGKQGEALAKFLELGKSSDELATAVSQVYLKDRVEPQLLSKLHGLKPGSAQYDAAIRTTLQDFADQHPTLAALAGVNPASIKKLSGLLPSEALNESSKELESTVSEHLKQFENEKPPMKSLALVVGSYGFYSAVTGAIDKPDAANVFSAFTQSVGLSQNVAGVAGLFRQTPSQIADFGSGDSALGDVAGKVVNVANLITNVQDLGADLRDGNTWGSVGSGAGLGGTLLKFVPEEFASDFLQGGLDPVSDVLTVASAVIGVGQLLFSGPPQPPSGADQLAFLKSEGFDVSQDAFRDLQPSNPSSDAPGSSPWKLLVKYAQDRGYNLQDPGQRAAFVGWVNKLAENPATDNTNRTNDPLLAPNTNKDVWLTFHRTELDALVQNLNAELDHSNGNVTDFRASSPNDRYLTQVAQADHLNDGFWIGGRARGVTDSNWPSNDHVVTVDPGPSDAAVVAPQSAYQIDQLLHVIGARPLPREG